MLTVLKKSWDYKLYSVFGLSFSAICNSLNSVNTMCFCARRSLLEVKEHTCLVKMFISLSMKLVNFEYFRITRGKMHHF